MLKKPTHRPRKAPQQRRSQVTTDAIIIATARLMAKKGLDALTTNAVAQVAGVSIGTLYQYYPDKAALIAGVFEREIREKMEALQQAAQANQAAPLPQLVRAMVTALASRNPPGDPLRHALIETQVRCEADGTLEHTDGQFVALVTQLLESRRHEIRAQEPAVLAYMVVHTMESLLHNVVLQPPGSASQETVVEELTRMVLGYLLPPNKPVSLSRIAVHA